ncbi:MAG TPA: ABC transporter permease [Bryobacteraceae bacterium]|nr:ABC transporter permease [Bryobacteraceae bacterium]
MSFFQDVRFGVRRLLREPGFTAVVVAALALGIGVNTTVFTLVNAVLFRGLPFEQPHRVMYLTSSNHARNQNDLGVSYPDFRDWRAQSKTFKGLAAFTQRGMVISDSSSTPERYRVWPLTPNAFSLIGQAPMLGRDFLAGEDLPSATPVCILGHAIWESRYGRDPNILGKSIRINDVPTTVVGVMPKGMKFPLNADLWTPLAITAQSEKRESRDMSVFGRLSDGASLAQAREEMDLIGRRLEQQYPKSNRGITFQVTPYNDQFNGGQIHIVFTALLGAVGFVLLVACANVANLLLSRALARHREISVRTALGAGRWRIIRQLLVESVLLGLLGGAAGLLIARWGVRMFDLAVANIGKPYWIDFRMDFTVFAYLAAICVTTGLLFGLAPAIQLSRVEITSTLKEGGRGSSTGARSRYLSGFLVVTEIALSMVLLVGAGLMVRSFLNAYNRTQGLHGERFLTMRLELPKDRYPDPAARTRFYERLEERLATVPGAESTAFTTNLPLEGSMGWQLEIAGRPPVEEANRPTVNGLVVSPTYFTTLDVGLVRGRGFTETDGTPDHGVAIINQRFAAKYFSGEDPIGKQVRLAWDGDRPWLTVVGVSHDIRQRMDRDEIEPVIYVPYRGKPVDWFAIVTRSALSPTQLTSAVRQAIASVDSNMPAFDVATLQERAMQQQWPFRVFGTLFAIFALIALLLSSVGLYAVMSYSVSRRTQEIGVRLAMGASSGNILRLVLSLGLKQLTIGLVLGLGGAFGLARVLKGLLVGVTPTDPLTFGAISIVLLVVGVLACWIPSRAAMKMDPTIALRYE